MKRFSTVFVLLFALLVSTGLQAQVQQQVVPLDDSNTMVLPDGFRKGGPVEIMGQWNIAAAMPMGKTYHTVGSADGKLFVFGGLNASGQFDATSYKYDPATDTWTTIASIPAAKYLFGRAETVNGKIYVFGGTENFGTSYKPVTDMFEYDPASDAWTTKTAMPSAQCYAGSAVINDKIYVVGGNGATESVYLTTVQVYDPAADRWWNDTNYPRDVKWMGMATVDGKIVGVGGFNITYSPSRYIADAYVGEDNGGTLVWTKVADAGIGAQIFPVAGGLDGKAYFVGGRPAADNNAPATARGFVYDIAGNSWSELPVKPTGVQYFTQSPVIDNKLYYAGGSIASGAVVPNLEIYDALAASKPTVVISGSTLDRWVKRSTTYRYAFSMRNIGGADLEWSTTVSDGADWLTVDAPTSGTILPGSQGLVYFTVNPNALNEGDYMASITVNTNDTDNPRLIVEVTIHVQEADVDEPANVLMEQYTGTWCQWCPYGADSLAAVSARLGDRVVRTSWHDSDPMEITEWDAMNSWIGVTGFPTASVGRVTWPGNSEIPISRGDWGNAAHYIVNNMRAPVGITITDKDYNPTTKAYTFKVKVLFHQGIEADVRLNAVVTEDGFDYAQKRYNLQTNVVETISPYIHKAVVRGIWPDIRGYQLSLGNSFATQTEVEQVFTFTSPHTNGDNAHLNVFVHTLTNTGTPGPVLQAVTQPLFQGLTAVDDVPVVESFGLRQNYPNPFNPSTNVTFDVPTRSHVRIVLHDALGRTLGTLVDENYEAGSHTFTFDGANLQSGTYYLTMSAGDFVQTRSMTLVK